MSQTKREQEMRFDLVYRLTEVLYESFLVANFIDFIDWRRRIFFFSSTTLWEATHVLLFLFVWVADKLLGSLSNHDGTATRTSKNNRL